MRVVALLLLLTVTGQAAAQPAGILAVDAWKLDGTQRVTMQHREETMSRQVIDDFQASSQLRGRLDRSGTNTFSGVVVASVMVSYSGKSLSSSGYEHCLMRNTEADAYLSNSSPANERYAILKRDPEERNALCRGREGFTFNAPTRFPQTRFDSAELGFCLEDIRVRDR